MTERLYYERTDLLEFDAVLHRVEPDGERFRVYLDRTAFYPESGGQIADTGALDGRPVADVQEDEAGDVFHVVAEPIQGPRVRGVVDGVRRFDHMQQHTGQHLLSAAFVALHDLATVGFHMSADFSTVDIAADPLPETELQAAVDLANRVVWEDRPVRTGFFTREEVDALGLRKPTQRIEDIRVVEVEGFDRSACGGTHVSRTGQIGLIVVARTEKMKGKTRLHFLCGGRAVRAFNDHLQILARLSALTTSGFPELPDRVDKLLQSNKALERDCQRLKGELLEMQIPSILERNRRTDGRTVVVQDLEEPAPVARSLCQKLIAGGNRVLAAVASRPDGTLLLGRSPDMKEDLLLLVARLRDGFSLKGGGRPDFAQLGGIPADRLESVLDACKAWFEDSDAPWR
jgi:alanyl-tRNA synthetase